VGWDNFTDVTELRRDKWIRWLEDGISQEVFTMYLHRLVWDRIQEMAKENVALGATSSYMWNWLFDLYAKTQAQAVRRQADMDRRAAGLARVIVELRDHPEEVTREWFLAMVENEEHDADDRHYWRNVSEKEHWGARFGGGDHFDPAVAEADLSRLQGESEKVREYVNKHVAHLDATAIGGQRKGQLPTLREVHEAVDLVGDYFKKYSLLLRNSGYADLTPVLQHDWEAIFRLPWIESKPDSSERMWREYQERGAAEEEAP
jgi:hypothetical protein